MDTAHSRIYRLRRLANPLWASIPFYLGVTCLCLFCILFLCTIKRCVVLLQDADEWGNEDATAAGELHDQVKAVESEEIGDMIEPPTKVA